MAEPISPDEPFISSNLLDGLVGYRLRRANANAMADFTISMGDIGIRPVLFALLAMVDENPGINQTSLGRSLGIQRANLVPLINDMGARGLIERRPAPNDRRAFALYLAEEGEALLAEAVRRVRPHEERVMARLSKEERRTLLDLLAKVGAP